MRQSEFRVAVVEEFGELYGPALVREFVIDDFGMTAEQAIAAGRRPGEVWRALCRTQQVPVERWHGRGLPEKS